MSNMLGIQKNMRKSLPHNIKHEFPNGKNGVMRWLKNWIIGSPWNALNVLLHLSDYFS